jgi:hypothetical protein
MTELELTRTREDRRLYALEGVGTLRLRGWGARSATAAAQGRSWELSARGLLRRSIVATDVVGRRAGDFEPARLRRGGALNWGVRELAMRPASAWRERYALVDGDEELAVFDGRGWGSRPVKVTVADLARVDAGLLLFAAFVVRGLAEDTSTAAAAATTGAVVAASG